MSNKIDSCKNILNLQQVQNKELNSIYDCESTGNLFSSSSNLIMKAKVSNKKKE